MKHGFNAGALHGDMDQMSRMETLDKLPRRRASRLLAASDVAARGLDIPDVSHIFNFDVPWQSDDYVHRIGRTGRAGKEGRSLTLVTPEDVKQLKDIEKMLGEPVTWIGDPPSEDDIAEGSRKRRGRGLAARRTAGAVRDGRRGSEAASGSATGRAGRRPERAPRGDRGADRAPERLRSAAGRLRPARAGPSGFPICCHRTKRLLRGRSAPPRRRGVRPSPNRHVSVRSVSRRASPGSRATRAATARTARPPPSAWGITSPPSCAARRAQAATRGKWRVQSCVSANAPSGATPLRRVAPYCALASSLTSTRRPPRRSSPAPCPTRPSAGAWPWSHRGRPCSSMPTGDA